jgi:hypothetical protein
LNNKNSANNISDNLNINNLGVKPIYDKNTFIQAEEFPYSSVSLFLYVNLTTFNNEQN